MIRKSLLGVMVALSVVAVAAPLGAIAGEKPEDTGRAEKLAVSWNDPESGGGVVCPLSLEPPWNFVAAPLQIGADAVLRSADGHVYALSRADDTITVIDADAWVITRAFAAEQFHGIEDIAVVGGNRAYITRSTATHLLRLDLETGATTEVLDLSFLADDDGIPEMGMMAIQRGRLFIQIRRLDERGYFSPPAYLAVMDIATEQLIDADPQRPGIQAIELLGTFPKHKMQRAEREDRLYVSATGIPFDDGGLEAVDTVRLRSLGLVVAEADGQVGVDLASFVFVGPHGGFLAYTTDIAVSSHLHSFSLTGEVGEIPPISSRVGYTASVLAFDRPSNVVFYPDGPAPNAGVLPLDGTTGQPLAKTVRTSAIPTDFVIVLKSGRFQ